MTLFADGHAAMGRDLTTVQRYAELLREIGCKWIPPRPISRSLD